MPQAASKTKNTETRKTAWRGISVKQKSPSRPNSTGTSRKSFGSISSSDSQQLFDDKSSGRDTIDSLPPKLESVKEYSTPLATSHNNKTTRSRASSTTSESLFQDANDGFMQQQNNMNPNMAGVQNNSYQEEEDEDDAFYYSSYFLADTQKVSTASPSLLPQQGKHRITSLTYGGPSLLPESQMDKEPIIKSTSLENLQKQSIATAVALDNNINKPTSPYKKERNNITEIYDNAITPGIADTVAAVNTSSSSLIVDDPVDLTTMTTKTTTETASAPSTPTPKRHSSLPSKKEIIPIIPPNDSEDSPFIGNTSTQISSTSKKRSKKSDKKYRSRSNSTDIHRHQENDSSPPPPLPTASIPPISNTSSLTDPLSKTRVYEKYIDQAPKDPLPPIPLSPSSPSPFSVVTTNINTNTTPNYNNMTSKEEQVQTLDLQKESTNNDEDSEDEHYNHPIINKDSIPTTEIIPDQQRQHQKPAVVSTTPIVSNHDSSFVVVEEDINQRRDSLSTASVSTVDSDDRIKFSEDRQSHSRYDFLPMAVEEDPTDLDMLKDNEITIQSVDVRNIHPNKLSPRDQEEADEHVREGMRLVFNNKFMRAKAVFQPHASTDPLYGVGLGVIATIKGMR
ncbi:hypothetical protein INT45_006379 [Circinella minor]|uniref:Uncharacterized protein n=1 Tax=Circinella minor TaxID=1195481 RepID=A0A8H7VPW4_9FUNG|nr:hypothetical protein INT45_006379 [Circinella minor]